MKSVAALIFLASLASSSVYPPEFIIELVRVVNPFITECICATNVDPALVTKWLYKVEYPNDACLKCFQKCIDLKLEFVYSDGSVNYNNIERKVSFVNTTLIKYCQAQKPKTSDLCQRVYDVNMCITDTLHV